MQMNFESQYNFRVLVFLAITWFIHGDYVATIILHTHCFFIVCDVRVFVLSFLLFHINREVANTETVLCTSVSKNTFYFNDQIRKKICPIGFGSAFVFKHETSNYFKRRRYQIYIYYKSWSTYVFHLQTNKPIWKRKKQQQHRSI